MRTLSILALAAAGALSITACGPSKVAQCNALVDAANKGQTAIAKIDFDKEPSIKGAIDGLEASNKDVAAVALKDPKLVELRDRYVKAHTDAAAKFKAFAETAKKGAALEKAENVDPAQVAAFAKEVEKMTKDGDAMSKESDKVIDDLNAYCSAN